MSDDAAREQTFVLIYTEHYQRILNFARRRTDETSARDIASETFLIAWRRGEHEPGIDLAWLYRTAGYVLSNSNRGFRRQQRLTQELGMAVPVASPDPQCQVVERDALLRAVAALRPRDQQLLLLTAWEGLDPGDLGKAVGCSRATVAVRLTRARQRLEAALRYEQDSGDVPPITTPVTVSR